MKIWLIKEGEPLPCDTNPRLMRMGLLAKDLVCKGHEVVWWSSTFSHALKQHRFFTDTILPCFQSNNKLVLLYSKIIYQRNTSISRILYHEMLARKFQKAAACYDKPDLIYCSFPTIQFAVKAIKYGKRYNVPVILDVRDLWPDIFKRAIPNKVKFLSPLFLLPFKLLTNYSFRNAAGITAIIPSHLEWGLEKASRTSSIHDRCFYIGYEKFLLSKEEQDSAEQFWESRGISRNKWNICFFGTFSAYTMDISTLISAMKILEVTNPEIRLILCGTGDAMSLYKEQASGHKNIIIPGWVDKNKIQSLMDMSKVGVYPFHNLPDFINSMTNKMIEYFSSGLPVLSTLKGFSKKYIEEHSLGLVYEEGSQSSFIDAVIKLYNDEDLRTKMSKNALKRYYIDFDSKVINSEIMGYFQEFIK
jgi:glycosyltransferase involved in cell wall biosynthesis